MNVTGYFSLNPRFFQHLLHLLNSLGLCIIQLSEYNGRFNTKVIDHTGSFFFA